VRRDCLVAPHILSFPASALSLCHSRAQRRIPDLFLRSSPSVVSTVVERPTRSDFFFPDRPPSVILSGGRRSRGPPAKRCSQFPSPVRRERVRVRDICAAQLSDGAAHSALPHIDALPPSRSPRSDIRAGSAKSGEPSLRIGFARLCKLHSYNSSCIIIIFQITLQHAA
jgi:hypothetical protein